MLSKADDFLLHQTPDTFDRVFTSDRNFYDRYYFNMHPCSDELFMVAGMGQYPNLGVTDAFVTVSHGTKQYTVRASRELGSDRLDTTVGPLGVEVLEGLRRFRITCEPNEWGIEFDLTWEGAIPPIEEPQFFTRSFARVVSHGSRITQTGFWQGTLKVAGQTFDVTPDRWWGARDHSWGVRPVGEPEAPGIRSTVERSRGSLWNWVPMQFKDFSIHYIAAEDGAGKRNSEAAERMPAYGIEGGPEHIGTPRHEMTFQSGTRRMSGATVTFDRHDQAPVVVRVTPMRNLNVFAGTGYGGGLDWRHGMYQGELVVQGMTFDLEDPETVKQITGLNDMSAKFELDGEVGYGMYEHSVSGIYLPYGFETADAVAP